MYDRSSGDDIPNLDLLRALAVMIVYFSHLVMVYGVGDPWGVISIYQLSQAGVMIFFVHTAFVLMLSLERQKGTGISVFRTFYLRRAFRIYPLSCLTVIVVLAASIPSFPTEAFHAPSRWTILANLTLTQNLIKSLPILNVLWSLPYEVQMYLALPFLFILVRRRGPWVPFVLWTLSIIVLLVVRIKGMGLLTYVPCFLGGVVGYGLWRSTRLRLPPFLWLVTILSAIAMRLTLPLKFGPWCASLVLGMAIPLFRQFETPLIRRPCLLVAKYSYGIYLSHCVIFWWFLPRHPILLILLSALIPVVLYHVVEDPLIRFGKRLATKWSQPSARQPLRRLAQSGFRPSDTDRLNLNINPDADEARVRMPNSETGRLRTSRKSVSVAHRLVSGSVLRVVSLAVSAVCSFLLMPFVVHHLGDRLYGFWSLASVFIGYYSLLDLGLSSAVSQYVCIAIGKNDLRECRSVFNTAIRIQLILGAIALVATFAIAAMTPLFTHVVADAHLFREVVIILGFNAAFNFPVKVYGGVLDAEYRFDINASLAILGAVLRTGLILWAILAGGSLLALAWMTFLASLPVAALQIWFGKREASWARIDARHQARRVRSLFSYSIYTFLSYLADILRFQVDPLVISGFIGLAAVTHYRVGSVFSQQYFLQTVVLSVGILGPVLSRLHGAGEQSRIEAVFFFGTKVSAWVSVFLCFGLIGWGKPFIARWMGPNYLDAYWPLVILALSVLLDVCQRTSIDLLYAAFNHRFYTYLNWIEGVLNLTFSLFLARPLGIVGVALGSLIAAFLIRVLVQPWWVCKVSEIDYLRYMRFWGRIILSCTALMGVAIAASSWGLQPSYPYLILSVLVATVIYATGSWLIVFNQSEKERLLAAITNRSGYGVDSVLAPVALQRKVIG